MFVAYASCEDDSEEIYVPNKKMNDEFDWRLMQARYYYAIFVEGL